MNTQTLNWEDILNTSKIEIKHIDFAINNINTAPLLPYESVYKAFTDKIYYPKAIAVSGAGGVIGAILSLKYASSPSIIFITTEDVINASQGSPLFLAKYSLEKLSKIYQSEVITLKLGEFDKIKLLLQQGGIYISGLPYELVIQISQLAGFGKLWHFSNIQRKFYVF